MNVGKLFDEYPDVVSVDDVQSMLHVGRNTTYKLLKSKLIETIRVGNKYIIAKSSVIVFLTQNTGKGFSYDDFGDIIASLDVGALTQQKGE